MIKVINCKNRSCINKLIDFLNLRRNEKNEYFVRANNMYDKITDLNQNNQVTIPKSLSEILLGKKNNHLLLPIAMEGGEALENKIDNLYHLVSF